MNINFGEVKVLLKPMQKNIKFLKSFMNKMKAKKSMNKHYIKNILILLVLFIFSELPAQWNLKSNTEDGKFSLISNSGNFFGLSAGNIQGEALVVLSPSDTSTWRLVRNNDNGLFSLAENKTLFMGVDSGKIKTKAVYILNPPTLASLGLDTNRLAYTDKPNSFIGRKQNFDTVNASVKYLLNGSDINTGGTLSNVAYLNQSNSFVGRKQTFDTVNATTRYLLNGVNINTSGTLSNVAYLGQTNSFTGNVVVSAPAYTSGTPNPIMDLSQTWNINGTATAFKINVTNVQSNSSSLLMDLQYGGTSQFTVAKDGSTTLQGAMILSQIQARNTSATLKIRGGAGSTAFSGISIDPIASSTNTSGTQSIVEVTGNSNFAPTSGSGLFNTFLLSPVINQTGGANGISRGIYVNPTVTAAADWRAFESSAGSLVMNDSYLAGTNTIVGPLVNLSQTWNTTGAPTMFKMNANSTASSISSLLMDLQLNGSSVFSVRKDGRTTVSLLISGSDIIAGANNGISWSGRGGLASGSASNVYTYGTGFNCFGIGGVTSTYPGLSPSANGSLKIMLADLSGYTKTIGGDFVHDDSSKGTVLKDSNGHYWRVTISTGGVLTTTDLGTTLTGF